MQSSKSNSESKLVLHMWEDSTEEHLEHQKRHKSHRHHHRSRHSRKHQNSDEADRIEIYVPSKNGRKTGPPTKPKPNVVLGRKSNSSMHSKKNS